MKHLRPQSLVPVLILTLFAQACVTTGGLARSKTNNSEAIVENLDSNFGAGHILLMQPLLDESAYASAWTLSAKLENLFEQAKKQKLLGPKTLVVLPADIGTWMTLFDQPTDIYQARSQQDALTLVFRADFFSMFGAWIQAPVDNRIADAVFRQSAQKTAKAYRKMMAKLARDYQVDLLAGSLLLPGPKVADKAIVVDTKAALQRCAFMFSKKGELVGQAACASEIDANEEKWMRASGQTSALIYPSSIGRVAVFQGWEAWHSERLREAKSQGAEYAVILQSLPIHKGWNQDWQSLPEAMQTRLSILVQNSPAASGSTNHFGDIFMRAGPPKMAQQAEFKAFAISFGHGRLWEQNLSGRALLQKGDKQVLGPDDDSAALLALWLGEAPAPVVTEPEAAAAETKVDAEAKPDKDAEKKLKKKKRARKKHKKKHKKRRRKKH